MTTIIAKVTMAMDARHSIRLHCSTVSGDHGWPVRTEHDDDGDDDDHYVYSGTRTIKPVKPCKPVLTATLTWPMVRAFTQSFIHSFVCWAIDALSSI